MLALPLGLLSCKYGGAVGVTFPEWDADSRGERSSTPSAAMTAAAAAGPGGKAEPGLRLPRRWWLLLLPRLLLPPPGGPGMCHKAGGWGRGGCGFGRRGKGSALGKPVWGRGGEEERRIPGEGRRGEGEGEGEEEEPGNTVGLPGKGGEGKVRGDRKGGWRKREVGGCNSPLSLYFTFP